MLSVSVCRTYDESNISDVAAHGHLTLGYGNVLPYDWQGEGGIREGTVRASKLNQFFWCMIHRGHLTSIQHSTALYSIVSSANEREEATHCRVGWVRGISPSCRW
jgi:hypothetical protein